MRCPVCAQADLVCDTRNITYRYKGEITVIPAVPGDYCPACGESIHDYNESQRVSLAMLEFNEQVNANSAEPGQKEDPAPVSYP